MDIILSIEKYILYFYYKVLLYIQKLLKVLLSDAIYKITQALK